MTKVIAALALAAASLTGCLKRSNGGHPQSIQIEFIEVAEGATTIALSADGAYLVADVPGEYGSLYRPAEPKQVQLFDTATWARKASAPGWAIGGPNTGGDVLVLAPSLDRVEWLVSGRSIGLEPPPNIEWQLLGAAAAHRAGRAFVVLAPESGRGLWVAVIDTKGDSVKTTATLDGTRRCGVTGGSGAPARLFVACYADMGGTGNSELWRVTALDDSAESVWKTEVRVPLDLGENDVRLAPSGDGRYLVMIHGSMKSSYGTQELSTLTVFDAATGAARQSVKPDWPEMQRIRNLAPVPGTSEVALLHLYKASSHAMFATHDSFSGITTVDAATVKPGRQYEVSRTALGKKLYEEMDQRYPEALAVRADKTVLLAD